ncbi:MAG: HEPN domain-containing protein [Geminicoccaceae bacterium]|nr:HEPN domain-containing protein [Geminicoccaceae bacterium]
MSSGRAYSIVVARAFLEGARGIVNSGRSLTGADLKVIHDNCHTAIEHALKYLLQSAGFSERELRQCGHDLDKLARLLFECEEDVPIGNRLYSRPPTSFRGIVLENKNDGARSTFGDFLEQLRDKASRYPSEVRYGETIATFPPEIWVQAAEKFIEWAKTKAGKIRRVRRGTHY